jgi:Spy/CpxP family protein refolding chaperone
MTDSSGASIPKDVIRFQLELLNVYETLLAGSLWDEAKVNTLVKTLMSSGLAMMRIQQSLSAELIPAQQEMIRQHRERLEQWLADNDDSHGRERST